MAHLTRYFMYKNIKSNLNRLIDGEVLGVSGIENCRQLINPGAKITEIFYPAVDLQSLPFGTNRFDCVFSDQVLEHIENPRKAIQESYRVLRSGGIAIHTTCFLNYIHQEPKDFWRFSQDALKILCDEFSDVVTGSWGNRIAVLLCFISGKLRYLKVPDSKHHPLHWLANYNEAEYPIVTWVIARK